MLYIILPALIIIVAIIYWRIIHIKRVSQTICCPEGQFSVHGRKNRFTIVVENGKIISVKDKAASSQYIKYGGH